MDKWSEIQSNLEERGWHFTGNEISAGVYRLEAWNDNGCRVSISGSDYDEMMNRCIEGAMDIEKQIERIRRQPK